MTVRQLIALLQDIPAEFQDKEIFHDGASVEGVNLSKKMTCLRPGFKGTEVCTAHLIARK